MIKRLLSAIGVFAAVALSGCSLFSPTIHVLDDYVYWEATADARYDVYINGEKTGQSDNFVTIPTDCDVALTVETVKNGNITGKVTVHRQADPVAVIVDDEASFGQYVAVVADSEETAGETNAETNGETAVETNGETDGGALPAVQDSAVSTDTQPDVDGTDVAGGGGTYDFRLHREGYSFDYTAQLPEGVFAVSPEVRLVRIATGGREIRVSFVLEKRTSAFILELDNAVLTGADDRPVVYAESDGNAVTPDVIVRLTGDNRLTGGENTADGADGAPSELLAPADADRTETAGTTDSPSAMGGAGGNGSAGYAAIVAPETLFCGGGTLVVTGGKGSDGGDGGDSAPGAEGGHGGDGGRGGAAVDGETLYVNCPAGAVTLYGGAGGAGGKQGNGFMNMGHDGSRGRSGRGFAGECIVIDGTLNR